MSHIPEINSISKTKVCFKTYCNDSLKHQSVQQIIYNPDFKNLFINLNL